MIQNNRTMCIIHISCIFPHSHCFLIFCSILSEAEEQKGRRTAMCVGGLSLCDQEKGSAVYRGTWCQVTAPLHSDELRQRNGSVT